jgi:hypothetical protein
VLASSPAPSLSAVSHPNKRRMSTRIGGLHQNCHLDLDIDYSLSSPFCIRVTRQPGLGLEVVPNYKEGNLLLLNE